MGSSTFILLLHASHFGTPCSYLRLVSKHGYQRDMSSCYNCLFCVITFPTSYTIYYFACAFTCPNGDDILFLPFCTSFYIPVVGCSNFGHTISAHVFQSSGHLFEHHTASLFLAFCVALCPQLQAGSGLKPSAFAWLQLLFHHCLLLSILNFSRLHFKYQI